MPKLRNMLGETGTVEIPVPGDDPLIVTYRRGILTPRLQIKMMSFQARLATQSGQSKADPESLTFLCDVFSSLIDSWNLTDDDGQVIGTDPESLSDVDLGILTLVMQTIGREMSADPLRDSGSNNGSTPRAALEPLQIGTASS